MLLGSIFFAAMGLFAESLAKEYSFAWLATIRSALAMLFAILLAKSAGVKLVYFRPKTLWMRSIAGSCAMLCTFYAMTHYDVSVVLALTSTYPIWIAVLGWPLLGYLPSRETWFALAVSTAGMFLVYLAANNEQLATAANTHYVPQLAIPIAALAAMFSGIALIGLHKIKEVDARAIVAHFSGVATLICLMAWFVMPRAEEMQPTNDTSAWRLLGVGVAATLGQLFLTKAFAAGQPARVSVVGLSQVGVAALYKWIVEGRIPSLWSTIGLVMILAATVWVMLRSDKKPAEPATSE
jgi:drug/metabolite transporter (DMT)-like permease